MIFKLRILMGLSFSLFSCISTAVTYVVNQSGSGDYTTIQAAVSSISSIPDTTPKFDTTGQTACFFGNDTSLENNVFGQGGTTWSSDVQVGDHISLEGEDVWYEVKSVLTDSGIKLVRPDEGATFRCGQYSVVEMNKILIEPGNYTESIDLTGLHFVHFIGTGSKDDVVISNYDSSYSLPAMGYGGVGAPFDNIELFGSISFSNLTINNLYGGSAIGATLLPGDPQPNNMDVNLNNLSMFGICCDLMFEDFGHVVIENVYAFSGADVFGGDLKSLAILNSTITSQWYPNLDMANVILAGAETKGVHVRVKYDSLIDNSTINSFHTGINPITVSTLGATSIRIFDTDGALFTISNSTITAVSTKGEAIDLTKSSAQGGTSKLLIENSYINGTGSADVVDIVIGNGDIVTITCSNIDTSTVEAGGIVVDNGCN